jgi:hypothetical protein
MKSHYSFIFLAVMALALVLPLDDEKSEIFDDYVLEDNSSNPPLGNTGAPGESSCVSCHSGSTLPAAGVVDFVFDGIGNVYVPGQTYAITISSTGNTKNGFQMTALDATNSAAGTFTAGTASSLGTANGRRYVRHSASANTSSWTFQWTAPVQSQGEITFYYAYAKANGTGGNTGDQIYLGNTAIQQDVASSLEEIIAPDNSVEISLINHEIQLSYSLNQSSNIYYCVQDLSGKQVAFKDFGLKEKGEYTDYISFKQGLEAGIYLVTVFVNNQAHTTKIFVP